MLKKNLYYRRRTYIIDEYVDIIDMYMDIPNLKSK